MERHYEDLAGKVIARLGQYAEARLEQRQVREFAVKNGVLLSAADYSTQGVGIRFFEKGSLGFCSTTEPEQILRIVEKTRAMAKRAVSREVYALSKERVNKARYEAKQKTKLMDVTAEQCIELLLDIDAGLAEGGFTSRFVSLELEEIKKTFLNSEGSVVESRIPRVNIHYLFTGENCQRFWQKGACEGWEVFKQWNLEESIPQEAREIAKANQNAVRVAEKVDLVVSPEIAGIIAHESCGHPYEADRILGREAAQAGESFLKLEMRGTNISNPGISVVDDPTVKGSYGYFEFDDEGTKAKPKKLIDNGKIASLLSDRINAAVLGEQSSGNSRAAGFDREPLIRMSNTFFEQGEKSEEELLQEVKRGVYVKRFMEWNIDDTRFNQKYVGCEAYAIENGRITKPVKNPVIETTTPQLYASIVEAGNNPEFHAASCGKGEPMQGMPVYMGGPSLLIKGVQLK
ncbi:TldD/PmbA family protein [Candidatus Micrarchaeota archaeon]|nr:TldD/PmbA family protein [Candidatus Micrarchaeota archaeon]